MAGGKQNDHQIIMKFSNDTDSIHIWQKMQDRKTSCNYNIPYSTFLLIISKKIYSFISLDAMVPDQWKS